MMKEDNDQKWKLPRPSSKRVWASLELPPETLVCDIFTEATNKDPQQEKEWIA